MLAHEAGNSGHGAEGRSCMVNRSLRWRGMLALALTLAGLVLLALLLDDDGVGTSVRADPTLAGGPREGRHEDLPPAELAGEILPLTAAESLGADFAAAAGGPAAPDAQGLIVHRVSGRLLDEDGTPVPGAQVLLVPSAGGRRAAGFGPEAHIDQVDWDQVPSTTSDAAGRFAVTGRDLPPDPVSGTAPASGADRRPAHGVHPRLVIEHPWRQHHVQDLHGFTDADLDLGDVVLHSAAPIKGRVLDEFGAPLPGALVTVPLFAHRGADQDRWRLTAQRTSSVSDGAGRYHIDGLLGQRNVILEASAPGRASAAVDVRRSGQAITTAPDLVLEPTTPVSGWVTDGRGQPLAGVEILARRSSLGAIHRGTDVALRDWRMSVNSGPRGDVRTRTLADGTFVFEHLQAEPWDLFAAHRDLEAMALRGVLPGDSEVGFTLVDPARLLLRVLDAATGEPLAGASGTALRRCLEDANDGRDVLDPPITVLAGADAARAAGLPEDTPGLLLVLPAGLLRTDVTVSAPGHARRTVKLPGCTPPELVEHTIALNASASLAGRVLDESLAPLPGARVELRSQQSETMGERPSAQASTDAEGRYLLADLFGGPWWLHAEADGHATSYDITVSIEEETANTAADLVLQRAGSLSGLVLNPLGLPVAASIRGHLVQDPDGGQYLRKANSDAQGRFVLDGLRPGIWVLSSYPGAEAQAEVAVGQTREVTLAQRRHALIRGRVSDAAGPVAGARVIQHSWGWDEDGGAVTDDQGAYELEVQPGTPTIAASAGDAWTPEASVSVDWDESAVLDLRFSTGQIGGRVLDAASGAPLAGVDVRADRAVADPAVDDPAQPMHRTRHARSDCAGAFLFSRVRPGSWRLSVNHGDFQPWVADPLQLAEGELRDDVHLALQLGAVR